jgi:hypothetical protein
MLQSNASGTFSEYIIQLCMYIYSRLSHVDVAYVSYVFLHVMYFACNDSLMESRDIKIIECKHMRRGHFQHI